MKQSLLFLTFAMALTGLGSCGKSQQQTNNETTEERTLQTPCPSFEADSAFADIRKQCDFGPRVPGTQAWRLCSEWIANRFEQMGLDVETQSTDVTVWDGTQVPCRNIIAHLNPQASDRILLCAHWDSRPWADNDPDSENHHTPVPAANDGASGVAVLLELARQMAGDSTMTTGIDFVCFDVEDYGIPDWAESTGETSDTWCLGSRYWAHHAGRNGYHAQFGILLDMVGGRGATFLKELVSLSVAEPLVNLVWDTAEEIGYGDYFLKEKGGAITDDHVEVNRLTRIPCIDIIPYYKNGDCSFGSTWHTVNDTPENIDPQVLKAVGQTVMQVIYNYNKRN